MSFFEIQLEIVSKCKLGCIHCSSESIINSEFVDINYSFVHLEYLIDQLIQRTDNVSIYLTGGEPLLFSNLQKTIKQINSFNAKLILGLFSSGIVLNANDEIKSLDYEAVKMLKLSGLTDVYLSIYSDKTTVHDYMVGSENALSVTLKTLSELKKQDINIFFNTVINKTNVNNLHEIVEFAKREKASGIRFLKLIKHGRAVANWDDIGLDYNEQESAIKDLLSKTKTNNYITVAGFPHLTPCRPNKLANGCQAGKCFFYIDLFGYLYPCGCTKNNIQHRICHISQMDVMQSLFDKLDEKNGYCYCR